MSADGASNNERLIAAARSDNEDMLLEVFEEGGFDINAKDGLGNTALHYAASRGSLSVLEHILAHEECDVDPINRLERATPLHLAMVIDDADTRVAVVESLLDAGADTSIKDKHGQTALQLLPADDTQIRALVRKSQAVAAISLADVADDDDGEPGSGSGSESE